MRSGGNHTQQGLLFIAACLLAGLVLFQGLKPSTPGTATEVVNTQQSDVTAIPGGVEPTGAGPAPAGPVQAADDPEPQAEPDPTRAGEEPEVTWTKLGGLAAFSPEQYPADSLDGLKLLPSFRGNQREWAEFKSSILAQAHQAPNFAGHYRIFHIGCGAQCTFAVLLDQSTGDLQSFEVGGHGTGENSLTQDIRFWPESALLLEVAADSQDETKCEYSAYRWDGARLQLLGAQKLNLPDGDTNGLMHCAS